MASLVGQASRTSLWFETDGCDAASTRMSQRSRGLLVDLPFASFPRTSAGRPELTVGTYQTQTFEMSALSTGLVPKNSRC
jgi:hypothetical protein